MTDRDILFMEARRNLAAFVLAMHPDFKMGWFHRELCARLVKFYLDAKRGLRPRLIINAPPRHGKSQLISRDFPAFLFGVYPDANVIAASYAIDLAEGMSRDVQAIMKSDEYREVFPNVNIVERKAKKNGPTAAQSAKYFEIPGRMGKYVAAGVGTGITGKGAQFAIIDDPFKDRQEADSPTIRKRVWDWYTSTFRTRLAPGGGIIVMHTRWHEDDLVGRLLLKMANGTGEKFELVNYPAIAETDERWRKKGEPLHPERYDLEELESIRMAVGSRDWSALYQGHPMPETGGIFKREWFRFYDPGELPKQFDQMIQSWDMTFKKSEGSDEVAGGVLMRCGADVFLVDLDCSQKSFTESKKAVQVMTTKYPDALAKIIEDKANGPAIIDSLSSDIPGIIPRNPRGSKTERANSVAPFIEGGNFWIPNPKYSAWSGRYLDQMTSFPSAPHDDMVDMTTQGLDYLINQMSNDAMWS